MTVDQQVLTFITDHPGCSVSNISDGVSALRDGADTWEAITDLGRQNLITQTQDPESGLWSFEAVPS